MSKRICLPLAILPFWLLACDSGNVKKTETLDSTNDTLSVIENNQTVPVDTVVY